MKKKSLILLFVSLILFACIPVFAGGSKEATTEEASPEKTISLLCFLKPGGSSPREQGAGELLKVFTEKPG